MNKLIFLKGLVFFMTGLIFLGLAGVIYGLLFYKKSDKTNFVSKKAVVATDIYLNQPQNTRIENIVPCGNYICVQLSTDKKHRIAIVSPQSREPISWIYVSDTPTP